MSEEAPLLKKNGMPAKKKGRPKILGEIGAIQKLDFLPIKQYPKEVRYADNFPARVLKANYPKIRDLYTDVYSKYNNMVESYNLMADAYLTMFKKYNSLLKVARNSKKELSRGRKRTIRKVKGDKTYLKLLEKKTTIKKIIDEHLAAKLWTLRYEDMPASLNVKLLYEKFLKDEGINDDFYRVLYVINIYRYALTSDMEWWGITMKMFKAHITNLLALGYVTVSEMGRNRRAYTTTHAGKLYLARLGTYADKFYKDLMLTSETNLLSDSFGIKKFAYSKYGRSKFRQFNAGADALRTEPAKEG